MKEELSKRHPRQDNEDEKVWQKAINARAFDVMRGFLPAGAATNLAWHTELRQANDQLQRLRNHPLAEVCAVAETITKALNEMYPSSFKHKRYEATESYISSWMKNQYYFDGDHFWNNAPGVTLQRDGIDREMLKQYSSILSNRPTKTEPPKYLAECGQIQFTFLLDFGSFRDIQRHRAVIQRMPLLTNKRKFGEWYFDQMPEELQTKARTFLTNYSKGVTKLGLSLEETQYYIPMGYEVACRITGDIPAFIWLIELRSGISVHPTLRVIAQDMGKQMLKEFSDLGLKLYIEDDVDRFNIKRGTQDIVEKT